MNTKFMLLALVAVTLASSSMAAFVDVTTATGCANYQFGYGSDCSCAIASNGLTVDNPLSLTFDAAGKAVTSDVTRFSADTVYIRYSSSLKYVNHTRAFKDGDNSACLAAFTWKTQKDDTAAACSDVSYLGSAPWTNALATNCGFDRKIEGTKVVYTIDFRVTVNEVIPFTSNGLPTGQCRGSCTTVRTITYKLPFVFKFETEVTVTSSNIDVFAPVLVVSALTTQEVLGNFPTDLPTLRTVLQTSVQWPFQIKTIGSSDENVADKSKLTLSRSDLSVTDYTVGNAGCPTTDNSLCVQTWTMNVAHANVSNANNCDFDGSYSMDFNIFCRGSRASSCPLAGEALSGSGSLAVGSVSFSLATGNACSQVAEQIVLDTWIQSFISDAARATATGAKPAAASAGQKDDFLDGQTIYFRVAVKTSEAAIDYTVIKNLNIYRSVDGVASSQSLITNFVKTAFGTSLGLDRNVGTGAAAGQWSFVDFSVVVSTSVLGFTQDQIFTYMFVVNVAVQYVNGGQPDVRALLAVDADGFQTFTFVGSFNEEAVATTGSDLVKGVVVSGSGATPAATSSSSSNSATTSGLIAGLSAFVALVAVVAGVMVVSANRRAAAAKAQFERTQSSAGLTGVSTDANSAHMSMADLSVQQVKVSYDAIDE